MNETLKIYLQILTENAVQFALFIYTAYKFYCGYKKRDYATMAYWGFWAFISFILLMS